MYKRQNKGQTNGRVESQIRNIKYALRSTTTSSSSKDKWKDELWKIQLSLNNAVSTATEMSPETMMFGYALPMRSTTLIQMDCTAQQENEGGTPRLPLRIRANQVKDMTSKRQAKLDKKNENLRENQYQVGDLVLKQVMQHTTVGTRHALECKYTGPYEIISIESSSVTLGSPSAKFATPVKCHVDQLKPFVLPDSPSTSPAWDQGLRHQINVPLSPISVSYTHLTLPTIYSV